MNQYETGPVPDDPGELGIDALLGPRVSADDQARDSAAPSDAAASGQVAGAQVAAAAPDADAPAADADAKPADAAAPDAETAGTAATADSAIPGSGTAGTGQTADAAAQAADTAVPGEGPPSRERLRDFVHDSRMRIWRRRILITAIAGGVFTIIFTWRLGLTIAILVAVADTIYRSRTAASVPPGVKVSHAQRRTQRQLTRMERSGYRALHSRPIPGSKEVIDHLVVGPTGVYAIDSEKWDRRLPIRTRNARQLWHGPESKKDRLEHAKWEAERASTLLSGNLRMEITVRPTMAVYGPKIPWDIATIRDVDVYSGPRVRKYLRKRGKAATERISDGDIEKIYRAAMTVLPF